MKREYSTVKNPMISVPGDESALAAAMSLANRFDGPTLRLIHDSFTALEMIGGQLVIAVRREKLDDFTGEPIPVAERRERPGQWLTTGFIFDYESRGVELVEPTPIPAERELTDADSFVPDIVPEVAEEEAAEAA